MGTGIQKVIGHTFALTTEEFIIITPSKILIFSQNFENGKTFFLNAFEMGPYNTAYMV